MMGDNRVEVILAKTVQIEFVSCNYDRIYLAFITPTHRNLLGWRVIGLRNAVASIESISHDRQEGSMLNRCSIEDYNRMVAKAEDFFNKSIDEITYGTMGYKNESVLKSPGVPLWTT